MSTDGAPGVWDEDVSPGLYQAVIAVLAVVALVSLALSSYLMYVLVSRRDFLRRWCPELYAPLLLQCVGDVGWSGVAIVMLAPPTLGFAYPTPIESKASCTVLGFLGDVNQTVSIGYYTVIGVHCLLVMKRYPYAVSKSLNTGSHWVIWAVSLFIAILPAITGAYGATSPDHAECWVTGIRNPIRLLFYAPVGIAIIFAIGLLAYVMCCFDRQALGHRVNRVMNRLMAFVGVFVGIWTFPVIDRLVPTITKEPSPFWLQVLHIASLCLIGTANFAVWMTSRPVQSALKNQPMTDEGITSYSLPQGVSATYVMGTDELLRDRSTQSYGLNESLRESEIDEYNSQPAGNWAFEQ